jgi:tRNA(adenine34) deaminase
MAERDKHFMTMALDLAREAATRGEVPVGAILVENEQVISSSGNSKETTFDPLGHAEIRVIQQAAQALGRWRLSGCTLYVTLEPCLMCAGALIHARVDRVVYGATDAKAGAVESLYQILSDSRLNHQPDVKGGVLADECGIILTKFFAARREANKNAARKS